MIKSGVGKFTESVVTWKGQILTIVLIAICAYSLYFPKVDDDYVSKSAYPVEASDYILSEVQNGNLNLETMKIYNDYNYGSYLLYRGIPVFIDSRADLYSPEFNEGVDIFSDYLNISNLGVYYEDKLDEYGITHVMAYENSKLDIILQHDENYKELYKDNSFIFYERLKKFE